VIQAGEDSDFLVHFIHLTFPLRLDGLASHLAIIDSIECEMDRSKTPTSKAMGCDGVLSNSLISTS